MTEDTQIKTWQIDWRSISCQVHLNGLVTLSERSIEVFTLNKVIRRTAWLLMCLLLPITFSGCWSYISKEAQHKFQDLEEPFSVSVYPVNVVKGTTVEHDEDLARKVVTFLRQEKLAEPVLGTAVVEIPVRWRHNQAKMAEQSANAFAAKVKKAAIQTDYALLVEILCNKNETSVGGVHFYLCDRGGLLASGGLTNSHWEEFKEVQPKDRQGGYEVLIRMLRREWKRS